eukprot:jgi/Ulvmu1/590/UM001_0598.1
MLGVEYESPSSSSSDSDQRSAEAQALTERVGDAVPSREDPTPSIKLPGATEMFSEVDGPPAFLDPEATRQSKICAAHVLQQNSVNGPQGTAALYSKANFDISKLAPRLKGQPDTQAVLSAPAKRGRPATETSQTPAFSNVALIAMMGGNTGEERNGDAADEPAEKKSKGKVTKAMPVQDFLAGGSGPQLPRHKQDRKVKEKSKRALGQSSHSHWKSEAEMVLRQQFDS